MCVLCICVHGGCSLCVCVCSLHVCMSVWPTVQYVCESVCVSVHGCEQAEVFA